MLPAKCRRGRPKGSGIDDSDRIQRLIELIRVRPELKPTTALRAMGIADPSAIRRLRDKYKRLSDSPAIAPGQSLPTGVPVAAASANLTPAAIAPRS
ncbi:MAG: hypothetical protein ACRCS9_10255 [Hyphomicrobium sp.]